MALAAITYWPNHLSTLVFVVEGSPPLSSHTLPIVSSVHFELVDGKWQDLENMSFSLCVNNLRFLEEDQYVNYIEYLAR